MKTSAPLLFSILMLMAPLVSADPKSLSEEQVHGYLAGKGMGFAKVAELNGYPGPAHVLELADSLQLTGTQREATKKLFNTMHNNAVVLGKELVKLEQELDDLFASHRVTEEALTALLKKIGQCRAQLRQVHIEAHMAQRALLTEDQVARYKQLRTHHHH